MGCLCGVTAQLGSWWYTLKQSGQLVKLWCGTDVAQKQKPYTLESIYPMCLFPSLPFFFFFLQADALARVCVLFCLSCGIVMVKCIFFMSYIAGETAPVGQWRCLFFLLCMTIGTICSNDFLLPLCNPYLKLEGFQYSGLGRGNSLGYI